MQKNTPQLKVNIREIARLANVSVATVSRTLKNEPTSKVSAEKQKQIRDLCGQLKYYPNEHTRRLFSGNANTVAFFFPDFRGVRQGGFLDSYTYIDLNFGSCLIGAQSVLQSREIDLLMTAITPEFLETKRYLKLIRGKLLDGILLWGALDNAEYVNEVLSEGIPTVMVQTVKTNCQCSSVVADDYDGMRQLTEKVLSNGHRKIAIVGSKGLASSWRNRLKGVTETLHKHGIARAYITEPGELGHDSGRAAAQEILRNAPDVTCIMALSDTMAYGCIEILKEHNISVPEDMSVTGADGLHLPGNAIRLDTFFHPSYEIGKRGAELLLDEISGNREIRNYCLPVENITGSTLTKARI
ncbi:MAG: LacI family transcriptional regulator [Victivallales bacterium]|jgi:DNA-binding LacI/PurR family transcriptional regulator|nr:LacI family transcriptional regulator [Victivallales bacterium]